MPYVVTATWKAKPGEEEAVERLLVEVAAATRREPGCIEFLVHRSPEDRSQFFLYEQFASEEAYRDHAASGHVRAFVLDDAIHRLDVRQRAVYELIPTT